MSSHPFLSLQGEASSNAAASGWPTGAAPDTHQGGRNTLAVEQLAVLIERGGDVGAAR